MNVNGNLIERPLRYKSLVELFMKHWNGCAVLQIPICRCSI